MGQKITVDSATLMNKGFEVIEAHYLFNIPLQKIKVVIHPECIIHSMVEFSDGSVKALLSMPDMKVPIQTALFYPKRAPKPFKEVNFFEIKNLSFFKADTEKFPCLEIAYNSLKKKGTILPALVFADEFIVNAFLEDKIKFSDISLILNKIIKNYKSIKNPTLKEILEVKEIIRLKLKNHLK